MKDAFVIKAGISEPEPITPKGKNGFTLREAQKIVGGYVEMVYFQNPKYPDMVMIANDSGAINGSALNVTAGAIAGQFIFGDVILCHHSLFE
jgi:hypothetical protein